MRCVEAGLNTENNASTEDTETVTERTGTTTSGGASDGNGFFFKQNSGSCGSWATAGGEGMRP